MKILHVVGARPNFMKAAAVMSALSRRDHFSQTLLHTGQHYDVNMSEVFFQQLEMAPPDVNLGIGAGSHSVQTAQIMMRFEEVLERERPNMVLVYGDVNSTVAAALVCAKRQVPVGHVEAGLRSFDRTMPEEINRILTDQISDLLFTPSEDGNQNLQREGVSAEKVYLVGNVMIDTLIRLLPRAQMPQVAAKRGHYALVTLHRPSNVDDPFILKSIIQALTELSADLPIVFPVHPRTRKRIEESNLNSPQNGHWLLLEPLGYLEFLGLQQGAKVVITDSGGVQEETTFLGVPCITLRENTERPVTVSIGTNVLVGRDLERLNVEVRRILQGVAKKGSVPKMWDGRAGERIAEALTQWSN